MFEINWVLIALLVLVVWIWLDGGMRENLRIQGSLDIRGEPITAPGCGSQWAVGPWNIGTSCPKTRKRMILEGTEW